MEYRLLTNDDWPGIHFLLLQLHHEHHDMVPEIYSETVDLSPEDYNLGYYGFGCFVDERLIGLCWGYLKKNGRVDKTAYVEDFIVSSEYRRNGIGSVLFRKFEEESMRRGARAIELLVLAENASAVGFYHNRGMETVNVHMHKRLALQENH